MFERKSILNILNESLLILEVITLQCNAIGDLKPHCKYRFVTINSWYCFFGNYSGLKTNGLFGYMTQESTQKNL